MPTRTRQHQLWSRPASPPCSTRGCGRAFCSAPARSGDIGVSVAIASPSCCPTDQPRPWRFSRSPPSPPRRRSIRYHGKASSRVTSTSFASSGWSPVDQSDSPAIRAAKARRPTDARPLARRHPLRSLSVRRSPSWTSCKSATASSEETALILTTSGTTSRPKIVAITQRSLCASATNIASSLALAPDRSLPECDAAVSRSWAHRRTAVIVDRRSERDLPSGLRCAALLPVGGRSAAHLVHGGSDHASGDSGSCIGASRRDRSSAAAIHSVFVCADARSGPGRARSISSTRRSSRRTA